MCFEAIPLERSLLEALQRLIAEVAFHGIFEAEFVPWRGGLALIDFNPRLYGQMGFDVARGLPLAELAHRDAAGDDAGVLRLLADAGPDLPKARYAHSFAIGADRFISRLIGDSMLPEVPQQHTPTLEFVRDPRDALPALVDAVQISVGQLRRLARTIVDRRHHTRSR